MAFKRFFTLVGNRTAVMDGKTKEVYRVPDVWEALRLEDLLNELEGRATGGDGDSGGGQEESTG